MGDEPIIRDIISKVVSSEGDSWGFASNGQEVIDSLLWFDYQIVLTDVRMPLVDGLQILKHVTANQPVVAVIMVTALDDACSAVEKRQGWAGRRTSKIDYGEQGVSEFSRRAS